MRDVNIKSVIIFALNKASRLDDLKECWSQGLKNLVPLKGSYNGQRENSYLVEYSEESFNLVVALAKKYQQESILLLDEERNAKLYFIDSKEYKALGKLQAVPKSELQDSWTYNEYTDTYYSIL